MAGIGPDGRCRSSNSSLHSVALCSTLAWLHVNRYTTHEEIPALLCGKACHAAMEVYLATASKLEALEALDKGTAEEPFDYKTWSDKHLAFFDRFRWENVRKIMSRWFDEHPRDKLPYTVHPDFVERKFEWPLDSAGHHVIIGRPDHIGRMRAGRRGIVIVDHKTTKNINNYFIDSFDLDTQISDYWWVTENHFDEPVVWFYVNAIEIKALPTEAKRKCREHGTYTDKCGVKHVKFQVLSYQRTPAQLKEWHKNALIF